MHHLGDETIYPPQGIQLGKEADVPVLEPVLSSLKQELEEM